MTAHAHTGRWGALDSRETTLDPISRQMDPTVLRCERAHDLDRRPPRARRPPRRDHPGAGPEWRDPVRRAAEAGDARLRVRRQPYPGPRGAAQAPVERARDSRAE